MVSNNDQNNNTMNERVFILRQNDKTRILKHETSMNEKKRAMKKEKIKLKILEK